MTLVTAQHAIEHADFRFSTDASTLRLPPGGHYPHELPTTLGNSQPFIRTYACDDFADYSQHLGCVRLRVFND